MCIVGVFLYSVAIGQDSIRLKKYFRELRTVNVSIGGKEYDFLFDTGGGETFISPAIANDLKKDVYGRILGIRMSGEKLYYKKCDSIAIDIGPTRIHHTTVGIWDVMSVLPKELPRIDGVISLKSFENRIISIDLANNRIIVETPASCNKKTKTMTLLNSRFSSGPGGNELTVFLGTTYNRRLYWFLFDTGNISECILSPQTAYEWQLQNTFDSLSNKFDNATITLGEHKHLVNAAVKDIVYDGALNYTLISQGVYTIDLTKNRVWTNRQIH